jgi:hypothetical protein
MYINAYVPIISLTSFVFELSHSACGLRSDDTTKLKTAILSLIHEDPKQGSTFAHDYNFARLIAGDPKELRGFHHIDTAAHLCPLRLKAHFEDDPL